MAPVPLACRTPAGLAPALHHLPSGWFLDKFIAVHQEAISRVLLLEELSAGQQSLRGSADESLRKRVWKRFTEGPASLRTSRELLFGRN